MTRKQFNANKKYLLEECDNIFWSEEGVWCDNPFSVILESYTEAGGDMYISLQECSKECLQEYIDNFNLNAEVIMYWSNGVKNNGVPFGNIKQHYEDLEAWLKWLQGICNCMPY